MIVLAVHFYCTIFASVSCNHDSIVEHLIGSLGNKICIALGIP